MYEDAYEDEVDYFIECLAFDEEGGILLFNEDYDEYEYVDGDDYEVIDLVESLIEDEYIEHPLYEKRGVKRGMFQRGYDATAKTVKKGYRKAKSAGKKAYNFAGKNLKKGKRAVIRTAKKHPYATGALGASAAIGAGMHARNKYNER